MGKEKRTHAGALSAVFVDECSDVLAASMAGWRIDRRRAIGARLIVEELLLKWMDGPGEGQPVEMVLSESLRHYTVLIRLKGAPQNPLLSTSEDELDWNVGLLQALGRFPQYFYRWGKNCIQLRLDKKKRPVRSLLLSIGLGLLAGLLGNLFLPEETRLTLGGLVLMPISDTFLNILNAVAGPLAFVSVLRAVCQLKYSAELGQAVKAFFLRAMGITLLLTAASALLERVVLVKTGVYSVLEGTQLSETFALLLDFIPGDIVSPFLNNDSPKVIVLALVLGSAVLTLGEQLSGTDEGIQKLERILYVVIEWLSDLAPIFVFFILIRMMWTGGANILYNGWRPILSIVIVCIVSVIAVLIQMLVRKKVRPRTLLKKLWPSVWMAFRTTSSSDAYEDALQCCRDSLGIDPAITKVSLPIGLIIYMPITAVATALLTLHIADSCGVCVTGTKLLITILLSVGLSAASLPVPGSALTGYAVIFSYLAIPSVGLAAVLVLDTLVGFLTAAMNLLLLEVELVATADRMKGLDEEILRS